MGLVGITRPARRRGISGAPPRTRASSDRPSSTQRRDDQASTARVVASIRKNNSEEIQVRLAVHDGFAMIDVRVFTAGRDAGGEPHATKKGICIPRSQLPHLIEALQIADREASR